MGDGGPKLDISVKIGIALVGFTAAGSAIALPNRREKEQAALDLFDRPWDRLAPQEAKVAEFSAGYRRWHNFFDTKVYPWTRQLPGAQNPILNPYKDFAGPAGGQDDED